MEAIGVKVNTDKLLHFADLLKVNNTVHVRNVLHKYRPQCFACMRSFLCYSSKFPM